MTSSEHTIFPEYLLVTKTAESEIKALEKTRPIVLSKILPLIEITRGRKIPKSNEEYDCSKRINRLGKVFHEQKVGIDLTSDPTLTDSVIENLFDPTDGYKNWCKYLSDLKKENVFGTIIPCIQIMSEDDPNAFKKNFDIQLDFLDKTFDEVIFRFEVKSGLLPLVEYIKQKLHRARLIVLIDFGFIHEAVFYNFLTAAKEVLKLLPEKGITTYISSTSFPSNISQFFDGDEIECDLYEVSLFKELKKDFPNLLYSDYGSVHPKRNDNVVMARGWIPRIDVPLQTTFFSVRKRRRKENSEEEMSYSETYNKVAKVVVSQALFPTDLTENWGVQQILQEAEGFSMGSNPSFWIAVRMNIHLEQQVLRLSA